MTSLASEADAPPWMGLSRAAELLDRVHAHLARFIAYPSSHAAIAHALWIAHAHAMDAWDSTPRIAFLSPEPGSGKTRALELTETLVPRPVEAVNRSGRQETVEGREPFGGGAPAEGRIERVGQRRAVDGTGVGVGETRVGEQVFAVHRLGNADAVEEAADVAGLEHVAKAVPSLLTGGGVGHCHHAGGQTGYDTDQHSCRERSLTLVHDVLLGVKRYHIRRRASASNQSRVNPVAARCIYG